MLKTVTTIVLVTYDYPLWKNEGFKTQEKKGSMFIGSASTPFNISNEFP